MQSSNFQTQAAGCDARRHIGPWLDTKAAAQYTGIAAGTLKRWRNKREGPRFQVINRRLVRYHVDDLDKFILGR